jgi:hypothetical protein
VKGKKAVIPIVSIPSAKPARTPHKAGKRGNLNKMYVSATFYIPRPTHKRLKEIISRDDTSLQQILEEAMDMWLMQNGEASFNPDGWEAIGRKSTRSHLITASRDGKKDEIV